MKTYLEQEGLPASTEECEEMLRMLVPMPPDDSLGTLPAADSSVASRNDGMSILADDCFTTPEDALAFMEAMNEGISSIMVAEAFHAEMEAVRPACMHRGDPAVHACRSRDPPLPNLGR